MKPLTNFALGTGALLTVAIVHHSVAREDATAATVDVHAANATESWDFRAEVVGWIERAYQTIRSAVERVSPDDAISRELTIFGGPAAQTDAISRELTILGGPAPESDAISREFIILGGPPAASDAISREFTMTTRFIGDINCDDVVNVNDIGAFVIALTQPAQYPVQYPNCTITLADVNRDGFVTVADIGPFVLILTGGA